MSRKLSIAELTQYLESLDAEKFVAVEGQTMTLDLVKFLKTDAGKRSLGKVTTVPDSGTSADEKAMAGTGG